MRVRANLTGKEYAKLNEFLRRWHDIPPPNPPDQPSPKRFIYSHEINELRPAEAEAVPKAPELVAPKEVLPPPKP
jgi:hypothetical protein